MFKNNGNSWGVGEQEQVQTKKPSMGVYMDFFWNHTLFNKDLKGSSLKPARMILSLRLQLKNPQL